MASTIFFPPKQAGCERIDLISVSLCFRTSSPTDFKNGCLLQYLAGQVETGVTVVRRLMCLHSSVCRTHCMLAAHSAGLSGGEGWGEGKKRGGGGEGGV